jgi:hypothetical protein
LSGALLPETPRRKYGEQHDNKSQAPNFSFHLSLLRISYPAVRQIRWTNATNSNLVQLNNLGRSRRRD